MSQKHQLWGNHRSVASVCHSCAIHKNTGPSTFTNTFIFTYISVLTALSLHPHVAPLFHAHTEPHIHWYTHTHSGCFQAHSGTKWKPCYSLMAQWPACSPDTDVEVMTKAEQLSLFILSLSASLFTSFLPCAAKWGGELRTWDELILTMWSTGLHFTISVC